MWGDEAGRQLCVVSTREGQLGPVMRILWYVFDPVTELLDLFWRSEDTLHGHLRTWNDMSFVFLSHFDTTSFVLAVVDTYSVLQ